MGVAVLGVVAASLITGELWRVAVDDGGSSSGNLVGRYGPHWLYPAVVAIVVGVLVTTLAENCPPDRDHRGPDRGGRGRRG